MINKDRRRDAGPAGAPERRIGLRDRRAWARGGRRSTDAEPTPADARRLTPEEVQALLSRVPRPEPAPARDGVSRPPASMRHSTRR